MSDEPLTQPPTDAASAVDGTSSDIDTLTRERDEHYDRLLRMTAEFDNYRKRVERERREQGDRAVLDLLQALLLVVDDFDLAMSVDAGEGAAPYRKGFELIHAKLHDLLRRQGLRAIDALGTDFDPNLHEAVVHEPSADHRENEVIGELRKGYMLNDRLLRPALVKVAKA
jgi:molecular chaperone GrpE